MSEAYRCYAACGARRPKLAHLEERYGDLLPTATISADVGAGVASSDREARRTGLRSTCPPS